MNQPPDVSNDDLVDRICIDLIRRRRAGESVSVQGYVKQFPQLAGDDALLDLIDAELCVSEELGLPSALDQLITQFPKLGKQIEQLANLPDSISSPLGNNSSNSYVATLARPWIQPSGDGCYDADEPAIDSSLLGDAKPGSLPVHFLRGLPDWLATGTCINGPCISDSDDSLLYRGRDARTASPLAIKILRSSQPFSADTRTWLLDRCEASASVNHSRWQRPILATVQESHFAVIRPWCFGSSLRDRIISLNDATDLLANLSTMAFAIASAHRCGAVHGGIHAGNVIIDHRNSWHLVDASSNHSGFLLDGAKQPMEAMQERDVDELIRMAESILLELDTDQAKSLLVQLRLNLHSRDLSAADLGEWLLSEADRRSQS